MPTQISPLVMSEMKENKRLIELQSALTAVDDWLKSDDISIVDKEGNIIEGARTVCKPFSIANRFIAQMLADNHW